MYQVSVPKEFMKITTTLSGNSYFKDSREQTRLFKKKLALKAFHQGFIISGMAAVTAVPFKHLYWSIAVNRVTTVKFSLRLTGQINLSKIRKLTSGSKFA